MAVTNTNTMAGPFIGDGVTTVFPYTFQAMSADEVAVVIDGEELASAYFSVDLENKVVGLSQPLALTATLYVVSNPSFQQQIQFENGSRWLADPVNEANDRAAIRAIWLRDRVARAPLAPLQPEDAAGLFPTIGGDGQWVFTPAGPGATGSSDNTYSSLTAFKASDISRLTASLVGAPGVVDGRFNWTPGNFTGQADDINIVKADSTALSVGAWVRQNADGISYREAAAGSIALSQADVNAETISAKRFGAAGNMLANDTAALQAANDAAALLGKSLYIPAGTYFTDPLTATTSWYGEAGTVIKYRGAATTNVALVTATGVDEVTFESITFDGNVSADPSDWATGYDQFTGAGGLSVNSCSAARVVNCHARNMRHHGFRFVECLFPVWDGCTAKHMRGNFGDGFIAISSIGISIANCRAEDFTRIGFVADTFGATLPEKLTCHKISLSNCFARNGHHGSVAYVGLEAGEYNAGFWLENVGDVALTGCQSWNTGYVGINICSGVQNNGIMGQSAVFTVNGCIVEGPGEWGILCYSLDSFPIAAKVTGCSVQGVSRAYGGAARNGADSFSWSGCHADYVMDGAFASTARGYAIEAIGTLTGKPSFSVSDCTINRSAENLTNLNDTSESTTTADVGSSAFNASAVHLTVSNLRHVNSAKPVYLKMLGSFAHDIEISATDFHARRVTSNNGVVSVSAGSTVRSLLTALTVNRFAIRASTITGQVTVTAVRSDVTESAILLSSADNVFLISPSGTNFPALFISGNRFEKNLTANGAPLRIGFGSSAFTAILVGNVFYDSGGGSTTEPFVRYAAGAARQFVANFADGTVTNITALDEGGGEETTVPGVTKITMH